MMRTSLAVVLAAGEGRRMKSTLPKVMHPIGGLSMIGHVLKALQTAKVDRIAVVVGPGDDKVAKAVAAHAPTAIVHVQAERRGTADAVRAARDALAKRADDVLVIFGDTPFVSAAAISSLREKLATGASVVVGGMRPDDPYGYGRLIMQGDQLTAIREERDASTSERKIGFVNGGLMGLAGETALSILDAIENKNDQKEFYLTDAAEIAHRVEEGAGHFQALGRNGAQCHIGCRNNAQKNGKAAQELWPEKLPSGPF